MGPTLKEEALDNHSTVSRVGEQKCPGGREKASRQKRLSDLFSFQEAARGGRKGRGNREKGTRPALHLCLKSTMVLQSFFGLQSGDFVISRLGRNLLPLAVPRPRVRCSFE